MTITDADVENWFRDFEDQIMDRKSIKIMSHIYDLAPLMVSFANNKTSSQEFGGRIIIGIDDNGNMERFTPKQEHEELIMTVARENCVPALSPQFEKVSYRGGTIYVITIPKMSDIPYQVKTKAGNIHKIRIGSTIREPTYEELRKLYSLNNADKLNIDLPPDGIFVKLLMRLGRWYLRKTHVTLNISLKKEVTVLRVIGFGLFAPMMIFMIWHMLTRTFNPDYDIPIIVSLVLLFIGAIPCFSFVQLIQSRKCEKCCFNFAYEKIQSKLLDEKQFHVADGTKKTMRVINNRFRCYFCNHSTEKSIVDYRT